MSRRGSGSPAVATLTWPGRQIDAATPRARVATPWLRFPSRELLVGEATVVAADAIATLDHLLLTRGEGCADLVHLDPPFGSEASYARRLTIDGLGALTLPAYDDHLPLTTHLSLLDAVLRRARLLLAPHGALYLHLDPRRGPYARLLLDEIFGPDAFINQIVWAYALGGAARGRFARKHDVIYLYARDPGRMRFHPPKEAATSSRLRGQPKLATDLWETDGEGDDAALLRSWPDELVRKTLSNRDPERTGYPTQKPLALATRMISASSDPGGLVVDPMAGSGTTVLAAALLGREVVAGDMGGVARDVCRTRLLAAGSALALTALDGQAEPQPWPGLTPVRRVAEQRLARGSASCPTALEPAVRAASRGTNPPEDITDLWSAWGVARAGQVLAWSDAGPQRSRAATEPSVPCPPEADTWWAVDVLGNRWQGPL